ncbi:uncharacterized protein JCM15063_003496 [Sporobolomyces koalae]|uniref:uncharacterized protein n=1 Tax=Sporobolomyces koalae TaxID=500713 RepID=UPI0031764C2D
MDGSLLQASSSTGAPLPAHAPGCGPVQEWAPSSGPHFSSTPDSKRQLQEPNDTDVRSREPSEEPLKRPRLPRIAEACIRCKGRKQRCVKDPGAEVCKNCLGVNAECIVAPRARRKTPRSKSQTDTPAQPASPRAAPSPSSLQNLLRTDAPPAIPASAFDTFATDPQPPPQPAYTPASSAYVPPPVASTSYTPYRPPPPPPAPLARPAPPTQYYNPPQEHHYTHTLPPWPTHQSTPQHLVPPAHSSGTVPPISDLRSSTNTYDTNIEAKVSPRARERTDNARNEPGPQSALSDEKCVDEPDADENEAARGVAFLSLNAGGNPIYVGPSSGFSWARLVLEGMAGASRVEGGKYNPTRSRLDTRGPFETGSHGHSAPSLADDALANVSDDLANRVLNATFEHIQSQFCFMDWLWVLPMFPRLFPRKKKCLQSSGFTAAFFIWMLFALGSRIDPVPGLAPSESYYAKAMANLETIVGLHDLFNVQALLLMVVYSFQAPTAPSTWFLIGIVLRLACSLGLHRELPRAQALRMSPYIVQLRRRTFWSAYLIDRMLATSLGRPCSIADEEIDNGLPLDYDVFDTVIDRANPPTAPTSMSSSICYLNLIRILGRIRRRMYRLDKPVTRDIRDLLVALDEWETTIPRGAVDPTCSSIPCCSRDWFLSKAFDARLCLLRPLTADSASADPNHLKLVARYAADACEIQKRLHQEPLGSLSLETMRTIFLNGLTLLHAVCLDRSALSPQDLQRAIRACSNTLYAYSQQFQGATAYLDCFEELASLVLERARTDQIPTTSPLNAPLFQSLWEEIPSMMSADTESSFACLLQSLGMPTDSLDAFATPSYDLSNSGAGQAFDPAGLNPFTVGGAGLW